MMPEWDPCTIKLPLVPGDCFPNHRQFLMYLLPYVADSTIRRYMAIAARVTNVVLGRYAGREPGFFETHPSGTWRYFLNSLLANRVSKSY
jgi:hypothetical protein